MINHKYKNSQQQGGFSLIEVAIGLVLLALTTVSIVNSLATQNEQRRYVQTKSQLGEAREAVMAFLLTNGRLPCPATGISNGQESILSNTGGVITCTSEVGFLPGAALGLGELDAFGFKNDAWSDGVSAAGARALRYSVTSLNGTVANALTSPGLGAPSSATRRMDVQTAVSTGQQSLFICQSSIGITAAANRCGSLANTMASNAVFAIWSGGSNARNVASFSADETQNATLATPRVLVSRGFAPVGASGGAFDDLVVWVAYSLIADRLFSGGFVQ